MKIEFMNGNRVESIDITGLESIKRSKSAKNVYFAIPSIKVRFLRFIKKCIGLYTSFEELKRL